LFVPAFVVLIFAVLAPSVPAVPVPPALTSPFKPPPPALVVPKVHKTRIKGAPFPRIQIAPYAVTAVAAIPRVTAAHRRHRTAAPMWLVMVLVVIVIVPAAVL